MRGAAKRFHLAMLDRLRARDSIDSVSVAIYPGVSQFHEFKGKFRIPLAVPDLGS